MTHRKLETRRNVPRGRNPKTTGLCQSRHPHRPEVLLLLLLLHHHLPLTALVAEPLSEIALVIGMVTSPRDSLLIPATNSMTPLDIEETMNIVGLALPSMMISLQ
jgi:hypothetical protein